MEEIYYLYEVSGVLLASFHAEVSLYIVARDMRHALFLFEKLNAKEVQAEKINQMGRVYGLPLNVKVKEGDIL